MVAIAISQGSRISGGGDNKDNNKDPNLVSYCFLCTHSENLGYLLLTLNMFVPIENGSGKIFQT